MKFSHTLSLNANPDWANEYLDYAGLKKVINELESEHQQNPTSEDTLRCREVFLGKLEKQISSIRTFYYEKRGELDVALARLRSTLDSKSASQTQLKDLEQPESAQSGHGERTPLLRSVEKMDLEDIRREICDLFVQYQNLKSYASLNCEAIRKIVKKYDKVIRDSLTKTHLVALESELPFYNEGTPEIDESMDSLTKYFSRLFHGGDSKKALKSLKLMVREFVTFQRHSVWLDVVEDQRKHESAIVQAASETQLSHMIPASSQQEVEKPLKKMIPDLIRLVQSSLTVQLGIFCVAVFLALLYLPGIFDKDPIKRNALAMSIFVSLLWATESLPLFVTSMLIPFLSVVLRVLNNEETGRRLSAKEASTVVFNAMFSHVIMLLIGGFTIAAALSKHNIAKIAASSIAVRFGSGIRTVLLVNQFIATGASMFISNVAAPVLCYSLIAPILKAASAEKSRASFGTPQSLSAERDIRLCRALVMGIALASNVGGTASPISSPQNLFAIEYTPIGWIPWLMVSIPLCIGLNLIIWAWLILCFQLPKGKSAAVAYALKREGSSGSSSEALTLEQYFVIAVSGGTVLLWCSSSVLSEWTGQMGVLGIVPFVLFFGTGILSKEDLNNLLWSVVVLAMGGLVLGDAVMSSGLIDVIAEGIARSIEMHSLGLWETLCIFTFMILICTTFVSHTVGAIVVLPIAYAVGMQLKDSSGYSESPSDHAKVLVFAGALACSLAMGLPVSGFPNMTAVGQEDHLGNRFLTTFDFIKFALPASVFAWIVLVTGGYALILKAVQLDEH